MISDDQLYCHTIGCKMAHAVKGIMRLLADAFEEKDIELTLEQYFLLNVLNNEDGLILQDLADIFDKDKSGVYHHIEGLEKHHFVVRTKDEEDRRRKLLFITKPGIKVLKRAQKLEEKVTACVTSEITQKEFDSFERNLSNICDRALEKAHS